MEDLKVVLVGPTDNQLRFSYDTLMSKVPFVKHYPTGEEALLNLCQDNPDVLIVDLDSSSIDPVMFCNTIKENIRFSNLPIVLLSRGTLKDKSLYFKGIDFMKKPFSKNELLARINLHKTLNEMCNAFKPYLKGA